MQSKSVMFADQSSIQIHSSESSEENIEKPSSEIKSIDKESKEPTVEEIEKDSKNNETFVAEYLDKLEKLVPSRKSESEREDLETIQSVRVKVQKQS